MARGKILKDRTGDGPDMSGKVGKIEGKDSKGRTLIAVNLEGIVVVTPCAEGDWKQV